jgi:N-acetyl-gamma-glutamyl-phosphate reductase
MISGMVTVGVLGASGFVGAELLRLLAGHPQLKLGWATGESQAGAEVGGLYPNLRAAYGDLVFRPFDLEMASEVDLVFCALPHGASGHLMPELVAAGKPVVDIGADFRLRDASLYPTWYHEEHPHPELLGRFAYGLPELFRADIVGSRLVAAPGCYPTAGALALAPLTRNGLIETSGIIVDAASGVSGAGRDKFPFCGTDENFAAYGLLDHRHTPELEQSIQAEVLFTPHLVPMNRGMLATCYARPTGSTSTAELLDLFRSTYDAEPFVTVIDESPQTKATQGSNSAHLTVRYDERTGWVMAICAIDNLVKGASGQMIQCANLLLGLEETAGLPLVGMYP